MLYGLKLVADAASQRGAGVIVAVVQHASAGELPADRVQAVAHNLSLDRRCGAEAGRGKVWGGGGGWSGRACCAAPARHAPPQLPHPVLVMLHLCASTQV